MCKENNNLAIKIVYMTIATAGLLAQLLTEPADLQKKVMETYKTMTEPKRQGEEYHVPSFNVGKYWTPREWTNYNPKRLK